MKLPIPPLSQKDEKWRYSKLGFSTSTIGGWGCNLVCHTMLACYFGYPHDPLTLNTLYKDKGVYLDQNLIDFWGVPKALPNIKADQFIQCPDTPAPLDLIDKYLSEQKPVIALVDFDYATQGLQSHFVLIIGKENNDYLINDPMSNPPGETYWFTAKYGDPAKGIYGLRLYSGPIDTTYHLFQKGVEIKSYDKNPEDTINDLDAKLKTADNTLASKIIEADTYRNSLAKADNDNIDLANQLGSARQERDKAISESKTLVEQVAVIQGRLDSSLAEQKRLEGALQALGEAGISKFSTQELLGEVIKRLFRRNGK